MTQRRSPSRHVTHHLFLSSAMTLLVAVMLTGSAMATSLHSPRRGGTIVATWETTLTTVDPAYIYGIQDWPQGHALFDGLLGFDTGTNLVPHMATSVPRATNGGKTYTFHLKRGLVFSNGDPITAQDVVFSWERMLAPKTGSPDTYLWYALKGQSAFSAGKAAHVSGLKVIDSSTLQLTLTQPYPGFLYVLATPSSFVVDPAVIHRYHAENRDFRTNAVGSGPFALKDWIPGQRMDLVRNTRYWDSTWPYADAVRLDLGVNASVGVLRIEKGQSDLLGDAIPSAQFASIIQSPALSKLVAHTPDIGVYTIGLNTRVKPFTDVRVRRAIEFAINKIHAIRFINGRGVPATGILPPNLPGFHGTSPNSTPITPPRPRRCWRRPAIPTASARRWACPPVGMRRAWPTRRSAT